MTQQHLKHDYPQLPVDQLQPTPDWWQVRVDQISAAMARVKTGQAATIATSAAGHPIWSVAYGKPQTRPGQASWAIGSNSGDPSTYKTSAEGDPQVVVLVGGVHAAEPEATAGIINLSALLETGHDLRGTPRPQLVELAQKYRLIMLPCVNMDGRAVSPDHLRGATMDEFRLVSQGVWNDGTPVGYPACKKWWPLPLEKVAHPGGYHTADGYNIMHDANPADIRTAEARALLNLVAQEQADLVLHMHSHAAGGVILGAPLMAYPFHVVRTHQYKQRVHDALERAGLRPAAAHPFEQRTGIGLGAACMMASGALSPIFEQSAVDDWSFDESLETFYVTVETFLEYGLREPFSPRRPVMRGDLPEGDWSSVL